MTIRDRAKESRVKAKPDAAQQLAEADSQIETARERLPGLRQQSRELRVAAKPIGEQIQTELHTAGREGREPVGLGDLRQALTEIAGKQADADGLAAGAEDAVRAAEANRARQPGRALGPR